MNALYFLRERLRFVRVYYDTAEPAFARRKADIEGLEPPFDDPPYSEDGEPPFFEEWEDADLGTQVLGLSCVSLLSDTLKLCFQTLQHRIIGFEFTASEKKALRKTGFLALYRDAFGQILQLDWTECPADMAVVEQIILARNRAAHGEHLSSISVEHDRSTVSKHPRSFFADAREWAWAGQDPDALSALVMPTILITRDTLFAAIEQVETLAAWIDAHVYRADQWRRSPERARPVPAPS